MASLTAVASMLEKGRSPRPAAPERRDPGRRVGQQTLVFRTRPRIVAAAAVAGPKEGQGPLGAYWDRTYRDRLLGERSWERAERRMCLDAAVLALEKAGLEPADIDLLLAGDLMNQLTCANFTAAELDIPFLGLFAACATWAASLGLAAMATDAGYATRVLCTTSSHHDTAERQYRFPTELGNQRPATSQWTATGAAAAVLAAAGTPLPQGWESANGPAGASPQGSESGSGGKAGQPAAGRPGSAPRGPGAGGRPRRAVAVTHATFGRVIDMGLTDPFDMGSAMAPAAADTIRQHLQDTGRRPGDYDLIVTGDLARYGHQLLVELLREQGYDAEGVLADCGLMLYDASQGVYAGGSGTACSGMVTAGYLLRRMEQGDLRRVLLVCTGCLHSTTTYKQGDTLPTVAHAVALEVDDAAAAGRAGDGGNGSPAAGVRPGGRGGDPA
ncbi:stage V sporulation protein AD [Thermaerobacter marianensis DSM 12885]|uniref:Stage V sporulation protein AD n=1 Tax=Thermaerobacter marianensis (strain ATCC 700841 / DSM 12885 / JCM 10246 / 7p75a) TaxID=644966 RepID=E6SKP2_THEM7|nr:stage V sporulation protein AD [Thermaerobacter marianensis]ADU51250.1 stage V sporulation protein AD [Thermaerobacter marianensis DSM 12885]